ncbi:restriction endonuclease subunit S [Listeria monocytogenes]|uniref:restriction endonuclease subunit S n=1 Tax=Listeria monocytogenes TaxID=1639 RepID=UPI00085BFB28|nr:restriction endonuclease subunit S [Listeria monocytogenes]EAC6477011.1 restriction endonuclease subunit S [Listeria monocytogenes]EGI2041380.1 restriction endonuclease subunit S [Listeria monocytogenes]EHK2421817.1 restriction endonuclease subunit S [Listeria monocytogenes]EHM4273164.1 restriction endonuclease subunit S [Listeria monocytogenes]EHM8245378.1 restriction endonuclease subunit S [Listeria monocytogenes]
MSYINKRVPKRRFEEFNNTDDWEQRKLGEIANSFEYGLNASSKTYDGENKYIRITDIDESSHVFNQDNLTSPDISLDNLNHYLLEEGDILLARTGASTGKSYCYNKIDGKVFFAGFLIRAKIKHEYNVSFIFQSTLTERYNNFIQVTSQRSGQPGINAQEYARFALYIPKLKEQQKIGDFFKQLYNTITLHQRKLEKIKALKTAYLSEMFPAEGETKPKRRFAGFTDDWEQRKFSQVADIFDGTHQTPKYTDFGVKFVSVENIATMETKKYISQEAYDKEYSNKKVEQGDVLMTRIGDVGTAKVIETDEPLAYYVTLALLKPKGIDPDFLAQQIASPEVQRSIWKRTLHIAFPKKINLGEINQVSIFIPDLEEQVEIGIFFKKLDKTITIHQRKLQKLQNIKKAYLNEMFI